MYKCVCLSEVKPNQTLWLGSDVNLCGCLWASYRRGNKCRLRSSAYYGLTRCIGDGTERWLDDSFPVYVEDK